MDPSPITAGCSAATEAIGKTSPALRLFIREVREARTELDAVLAELHSLGGVIDILKDDAGSFPVDLAQRTPPVLTHCSSIVNQIDGYMQVCNGIDLSKRDKRFRWLAIRADMVKLKLTLEGYKSILALVTDLVGLTKSRKDIDSLSVKSDSSHYHDVLEDRKATNDDMKTELTHLLADMGSLRGRLQGDFKSNYAVSDLESYLDAMQLNATNLGHRMNVRYSMQGKVMETTLPLKSGNSVDGRIRFPSSGTNSSMGDEPDSAIDINDGPPSPYQQSPTVDKRPEQQQQQEGGPAPPNISSMPIIEIDEFLDELSDGRDKPSRAPTPPPKARARRLSVADNGGGGGNQLAPVRPSPSVRSVSDYGAMNQDVDDDYSVLPRRRSSIHSHAESDNDARSTLGSLMGIRPAFSEAEPDVNHSKSNLPIITGDFLISQNAAPTPSTDDRTGRTSRRLFGRNHSFSVPGRPTRPDTAAAPTANRSTSQNRSMTALKVLSGPGTALAIPAARADASASSTRLPAHDRNASVDTKYTFLSTSSSGKAPRSSTGTAASIRSTGSRMSSVFSRMTSWKPSRIKEEPVAEDTEPDDIFGVSLKKSMQIASATVRTHHNGSKGSSRREFPRVILTCVSFIKENDGIKAPNIFGENFSMDFDTDHLVRVSELKQCFSTAPYYGEGNIEWEQYDVYDAAEMIVLFLQQLPKPLITETVAKRWIVLSRQASVPGSMGLRLDSCIDFWDEALLGVRGPARSMFKLLLNLWGDIADAADINDMTAERLASRLLNPLMHLPAGKYTTDLMLGLAFLIRKRSEYAVMLREGRQSKAAF
ncbi:hypothetical protein N0V93_008672 [Gnomoniopsis smithogilvyi]|uniref:Rho-GAP domain-containing protein n=1 Tax=Gnomoniopsis smithogilvyi TaxID=1191159 RepID=A0A9W9CV02_9PEZI|nr:hypothetical protein N0V93_008672 [Gnomoniopsis smithogilvyi]